MLIKQPFCVADLPCYDYFVLDVYTIEELIEDIKEISESPSLVRAQITIKPGRIDGIVEFNKTNEDENE